MLIPISELNSSKSASSGAPVKGGSTLDLKAGEWVEVRTWDEIRATLDAHGRLQNLPFMAEMLQYCGRRFRVFKRADKTCDYIQGWSIRRMTDTVHLEGLRCDGAEHDGCQAGCLIFWKEAWLKRPDTVAASTGVVKPSQLNGSGSVDELFATAKTTASKGEVVYSCQGTDVPRFTSYMSTWDLRQYLRDIRSGNLDSGLADRNSTGRLIETALAAVAVLRSLIITVFNRVQTKRHGQTYPFLEGTSSSAPVAEPLDLQPGELVEVRTKEEIMATLDEKHRNRGLWFDVEMLPYCGGIYRVLRRVHRIIDEKTGRLITMKHPCIVLEGVVCRSDYHRLCPRAIYPYWRECWLKRASVPSLQQSNDQSLVCHQSH